MPKITVHGGPSDARVDVQAPILAQPKERPGEGAFHAERNATDYSALTVKQLVAEIERRNAEGADIATTGNKGDLVARLEEDDTAEQDEE